MPHQEPLFTLLGYRAGKRQISLAHSWALQHGIEPDQAEGKNAAAAGETLQSMLREGRPAINARSAPAELARGVHFDDGSIALIFDDERLFTDTYGRDVHNRVWSVLEPEELMRWPWERVSELKDCDPEFCALINADNDLMAGITVCFDADMTKGIDEFGRYLLRHDLVDHSQCVPMDDDEDGVAAGATGDYPNDDDDEDDIDRKIAAVHPDLHTDWRRERSRNTAPDSERESDDEEMDSEMKAQADLAVKQYIKDSAAYLYVDNFGVHTMQEFYVRLLLDPS